MNTNGEDLIIVNVSGTMPACVCSCQWVVCRLALQWGPADAEVVVPSVETPGLTNVLPLKPGVGQNIAMDAWSVPDTCSWS